MTNLYDVTIKKFDDGSIQYRASFIHNPYNNFSHSPGSEFKHKYSEIEINKISYNRTVDKCYDIVHSNNWDYFITLTLDPEKVDRYDFISCSDCIHKFTDLLYRDGVKWFIVPEKHADGAWHFHGLLSDCDNLQLFVNDNYYLTFRQYTYGFCSLSHVSDSGKAANYILKYMIKGYNYLDIPKGKKRYWASRKLGKPIIDHDVFTEDYLTSLIDQAYYVKKIDNDFMNGYILDMRSNDVSNLSSC